MRFVHRQQPNITPLNQVHKLGFSKTFGRHIQQVIGAIADRLVATVSLVASQRRVDKRGRDSFANQRIHLIFHQRNQRRDHQRQTRFGGVLIFCRGEMQRRNLITERLAHSGRHDHQRVFALANPLDNLTLTASKFRVVKILLQDVNVRVQLGYSAVCSAVYSGLCLMLRTIQVVAESQACRTRSTSGIEHRDC